MSRVILAIAIIGGALLLFATVFLITLNWSGRVFGPLVSFLVGGTVTTLVTLTSMLQPSSADGFFLTSVVLDTAEGAPPIVGANIAALEYTRRMSDYTGLGHPVRMVNGAAKRTDTPPKTTEEMFSYGGELIQYEMLHILQTVQVGSTSILTTGGSVITSVNRKPKLSRVTDYPGSVLLQIAAPNRFANSQLEDFRWESSHLPLPQDTSVVLGHTGSPTSGVERYTLSMKKRSFFDIEVTIEPTMSPGLGAVRKDLNLDRNIADRSQTFNFQVTLSAAFERITAANWQTEEFKNWVTWLFSEWQRRLAD